MQATAAQTPRHPQGRTTWKQAWACEPERASLRVQVWQCEPERASSGARKLQTAREHPSQREPALFLFPLGLEAFSFSDNPDLDCPPLPQQTPLIACPCFPNDLSYLNQMYLYQGQTQFFKLVFQVSSCTIPNMEMQGVLQRFKARQAARDSSRRKKSCRATEVLDMPLFKGRRSPHAASSVCSRKSLSPYILKRNKASKEQKQAV